MLKKVSQEAGMPLDFADIARAFADQEYGQS